MFANKGARIVISYKTSATRAEETLSLLEGTGQRHLAVRADVSNSKNVRAMFQRIDDECGRLDVLVNNAGVNRDARLQTMTEAMWDEVLTTNLKGAFLCAQSAAPLMLKNNRGAIVNTASETALTGRVGGCNYVAAKAGVIGLTKALAR